MNYYERHIGDYIRDTVSLSMIEDGAYNRLMDQYYQTERPLPLDKKMVYRLSRASTTAERKAVDFVLEYFFVREDDGYHQKRINAEIDRYQEKQRKAKASANARWNKSERNANASKAHAKTHMQNACDDDAHQAPSTKHQTPDTRKEQEAAATTAATEGHGQEPAALPSGPVHERKLELVSMLRKRGAALQAGDPRVERWAANGVTDAQALQALEIAQQRREAANSAAPINAGYLDTILADLREPKDVQTSGKPGKAEPQDRWWMSNNGIDRKGREMGMFARPSEDYASFKDRIFEEIRRREAEPSETAE